jgi:D-serine dehydratase
LWLDRVVCGGGGGGGGVLGFALKRMFDAVFKFEQERVLEWVFSFIFQKVV